MCKKEQAKVQFCAGLASPRERFPFPQLDRLEMGGTNFFRGVSFHFPSPENFFDRPGEQQKSFFLCCRDGDGMESFRQIAYLLFRDPVDLVEDQQGGQREKIEVGKDLFYRLHVVLEGGAGQIDYMEKEICIVKFIEGCPESAEEIFRQVSDEAHRIGDDHLPLPGKAKAPGGGVQCGEEFVLHEDCTLGEGV